MPTADLFFAFLVATILMNISPGPSMLYVMARGISHGFKGGLVAALGLATGSLFYVFATALGLSVLFTYSPQVYLMLKLAGAVYLIYLGYRYINPLSDSALPRGSQPVAQKKTLTSIFSESVLVEITNPKTALFFIAFLPQFVSESHAVAPQLLVLGLIVTITALPFDLLVAAGSNKAASWLSRNQSARRAQEWASGSTLVSLGGFIGFRELRQAMKAQVSA